MTSQFFLIAEIYKIYKIIVGSRKQRISVISFFNTFSVNKSKRKRVNREDIGWKRLAASNHPSGKRLFSKLFWDEFGPQITPPRWPFVLPDLRRTRKIATTTCGSSPGNIIFILEDSFLSLGEASSGLVD